MDATIPYFLQMREAGKTCPRCAQARAEVRATGLTLSDVYDHGEDFCGAQSVETFGPATYGHPRAYAQVRALPPSPAAGGAK